MHQQLPFLSVVLICVFQLIHECKEVLNAAVTVKQYYQQMVCSVASHADGFDLDLETYEDDLMKMLEVNKFNYYFL